MRLKYTRVTNQSGCSPSPRRSRGRPREETLAPPPSPLRLNPLPRRRLGRLRPKAVWRWQRRGGSLPHAIGDSAGRSHLPGGAGRRACPASAPSPPPGVLRWRRLLPSVVVGGGGWIWDPCPDSVDGGVGAGSGGRRPRRGGGESRGLRASWRYRWRRVLSLVVAATVHGSWIPSNKSG